MNTNNSSTSERRVHIRVAIPAQISIDGKTYPTRNLSIGGFSLEAGQDWGDGTYQAQICVFYSGIPFTFPATVQPLFRDAANGHMGFQFHGMTEDVLGVLEKLIDAVRVNGVLADLEELESCVISVGGFVSHGV